MNEREYLANKLRNDFAVYYFTDDRIPERTPDGRPAAWYVKIGVVNLIVVNPRISSEIRSQIWNKNKFALPFSQIATDEDIEFVKDQIHSGNFALSAGTSNMIDLQ